MGNAIKDIIDESHKPGNGDLGGAIGDLIGTIIGAAARSPEHIKQGKRSASHL
ncbi:MAG: hypothetical protein V8S72_08900 [Oscillospiraceae bacterium]